MAASRLSDPQKQELVARWRAGESSSALAQTYGCSPNTVTRVVKTALGAELYNQLKLQRGQPEPARAARGAGTVSVTAAPSAAPVAVPMAPIPLALDDGDDDPLDPEDADDGGAGVLAIDDADDFGDASEEDSDAEEDGDADEASFEGDDEGNVFTTVAVSLALDDRPPAACQPLEQAALPESLYMLVDKLVELQARPLSDFPELGRLSDDEQARQALVVFANPRQAKRHCGRTQRVIKLPDSRVIGRTAPYLLTQGITRLVMEGAVYALPGS